ncbi:hypothetical protein F5141DRAFT_174663 [Pisolithus sp. B1]|nr:hypothetical protein F5141DRAFT_174663 [Pisolithus sp. B1]
MLSLGPTIPEIMCRQCEKVEHFERKKGDTRSISHSPSPFEACRAVPIPVAFVRVFARCVLSKSGAINVTSRVSCYALVVRCDRTTQQLPERKAAVPSFLSIIPLHSRTKAFGIASLPFACTVYSLLNVITLFARSLHRCAARSVPLVEHDSSMLSPPSFSRGSPAFSGGGADSHSFIISLARLCLVCQDAE